MVIELAIVASIILGEVPAGKRKNSRPILTPETVTILKSTYPAEQPAVSKHPLLRWPVSALLIGDSK